MTQAKFHVIQHLLRVRHHLSLEVEEADMGAFTAWACEANALTFLPDGTVRDPWGAVLIPPDGSDPDPEAELPYPPDARARREATLKQLEGLGVATPPAMPPVVSEVEVELRQPDEVARRAMSLFAVAVRAESLNSGEPIPVSDLRDRLPQAFEALSPNERAFLAEDAPDPQAVVDAAWRYEALAVLQWALAWSDDLPLPTGICDVPATAQLMLEGADARVAAAALRPTPEVLDALALHRRLNWAAREARIAGGQPPAGLDPGVLQERHHALNWLVRYQDADWDDVDTPT
jgi:hypothetical protein